MNKTIYETAMVWFTDHEARREFAKKVISEDYEITNIPSTNLVSVQKMPADTLYSWLNARGIDYVAENYPWGISIEQQ